ASPTPPTASQSQSRAPSPPDACFPTSARRVTSACHNEGAPRPGCPFPCPLPACVLPSAEPGLLSQANSASHLALEVCRWPAQQCPVMSAGVRLQLWASSLG